MKGVSACGHTAMVVVDVLLSYFVSIAGRVKGLQVIPSEVVFELHTPFASFSELGAVNLHTVPLDNPIFKVGKGSLVSLFATDKFFVGVKLLVCFEANSTDIENVPGFLGVVEIDCCHFPALVFKLLQHIIRGVEITVNNSESVSVDRNIHRSESLLPPTLNFTPQWECFRTFWVLNSELLGPTTEFTKETTLFEDNILVHNPLEFTFRETLRANTGCKLGNSNKFLHVVRVFNSRHDVAGNRQSFTHIINPYHIVLSCLFEVSVVVDRFDDDFLVAVHRSVNMFIVFDL